MTAHGFNIRDTAELDGMRGSFQAVCVGGDWEGTQHWWGPEPGVLSKSGADAAAHREGAQHWRTTVADDSAPAEHVATLVARSPGRVVSMICSCGVSVVGDVMPFAGVTRLMLEHLNGEKAAAQELSIVDDKRPHSRACSLSYHTHGLTCAPSCPTCGGSNAPHRAAPAAPSIDDLVDTFIQRIAGANLTLQQADRIITQARVRCRTMIPEGTSPDLVRRVFPYNADD